ncbi:unnamed protein product [Rotaria sp. Silwood1]|nr:unnamed protein product [Rotaria sp. Silwood1]CAF1208460.1 unnamed protein product [Rotaria sp. Silwood1]
MPFRYANERNLILQTTIVTILFSGTGFTWFVTAAGAALVFIFHSANQKLLDYSLGFGAGVMTAASFWSLLEPAFKIAHEQNFINIQLNFILIIIGFLLGALFVYMADLLLPSITSKQLFQCVSNNKTHEQKLKNHQDNLSNLKIHSAVRSRLKRNQELTKQAHRPVGDSPIEEIKEININTNERTKWHRLLLLIIAVTVHNFPEGMAVGVAFGSIASSSNATLSFNHARKLALGIGIQNFPEGLAISLPLRSFGIGCFKAFWYGQLSGLVEIIAGLLGVCFVQLANCLLPFSLSFAAGAMLFVVFNEIIPEITPSHILYIHFYATRNRSVEVLYRRINFDNTESIYTECLQKLCAPYGKNFSTEAKLQMMGKSSLEVGQILIRELDLPMSDDEFLIKSNELYQEAFPSAELLPGAERLIEHLAAHDIPMAIGTGSSYDLFMLKTSGHRELFKLFDPVICTDATEIRLTKPEPDVFLACAEKFQNPPLSMSQCLVFEDGENGVRAALAAGMKVILVPSLPLSSYDPSIIQHATLTLDSLLKFDPVEFVIPSTNAANANVTIDYMKLGGCNSTIVARVGDYCDHIVKITISVANSSSSSTDLSVEIILLDNVTTVMQMSKPTITYVGGNFLNSANLYQPTITMTSQLNTSQFDDARIGFGTVVNNGLVAPNNDTESTIMISFRSVIISNPSYQVNGATYWVTVGVEYNNVSEIWIGQSLFNFSNSSNSGSGSFTISTISNSSLQIPQGSPFALLVPINYNNTYASNFVFTITNNNPSQLGLCSTYVQSATSGFAHLPTLGYEISLYLTTSLTNNQISITLGQIVNTQSYSGTSSTLYIVVYGRIFKTDSSSSYIAGTMTAQVSTTTSSTVTQTFTIYAIPAVIAYPLNGSMSTLSLAQQTNVVGIYQTLQMTVTMVLPNSFSAPVVIELHGSLNTSTPNLKPCTVIFQSAGENVGSSNPQCVDQSLSRFTYTSSTNSTIYDHLSYDYGVMSNMGTRSTIYSTTVNTIVFNAIFQVLNTTANVVSPTIIVTLGNNTIWLGNANVNVTTINYNITNATQPTFSLSYENNSTTNQSATMLGYTRLFYYDIYTKASGIYTPMILKITTNETSYGSGIPAASICLVKILYIGSNLPCLIQTLYNQDQSPFITYSSRYNQRKNDTVNIQFGPLCNYQTTQTNNNLGRIRVGVYVKIESLLGDGQSTYVSLDIYYAPSNLWIGQVLFTGYQPVSPPNVVGTPLMFPLNSTTQSFNRNSLTIVNYGLKIPVASVGTYSSLNSAIINEANQQTSVCRVDISPNRGSNVPCSNDVSSVFTYNSNGYSSVATTNLGMMCNIASNTSTLNSSLSIDSDTLIMQVFLLATSQTSSTFDLTLSNLTPSGQAALGTLTSTFNSGLTSNFGNISPINSLSATNYQQLNDTNNSSLVYLGQDVLIRTQFILAYNLSSQTCYPLLFQFSFMPSNIDAAYFTNAFFISSGDNLMCMQAKAIPILSSGGSTLYNTSMYLDLGVVCYYPIDPMNISASTLIIQSNARVPVTTTVPIGNQISLNIAALINNNQSSLNTSVSLIVKNHTTYSGFTLFSNDTTNVLISAINSTIQSGIRQIVTYNFKVYLPTYSQGRLQIFIASTQMSNSVTIHIISADILSAGINVGSFMYEYVLGNKYHWIYSSSVLGSSYQDTAYLDLGVVTNTGTSAMLNTFSNTTDNFIIVQANGYLTDSPLAEENSTFSMVLTAIYGGINVSNSFSNVVSRNGTERPIMFVNHTDITSGIYGIGSTYSGRIQYGHENNSTAECINAQIIIYLPTWISFQSYNSTTSAVNYTTDNNSYVLFNLGTLLFNDVGSLTFTLNIGTSNQMALVYQRYNSPSITIPYELICMKRARANVAYYPASKIFAFTDIISLSTAIVSVLNYATLLDTLDPCQFTTSVVGSDASLVRTTGWQTGYRSNQWMLSGSTYVQINFGNLTLINGIQLTVPTVFASILFVQLGFSWDGNSFAVDPTKYFVNGSSSYIFPLSQSLLIRHLRVYLIDVVQPNDLLIKTSGFILNITGLVNSTNVTVANVCPSVSNTLSPRTILVAPPSQVGLSYSNDIYVCDETITRTLIVCHLLFNGDMSAPATWTVLNTTVANIKLFVYDTVQQTQYLYGYAQDGVSIVRSDDRGIKWSVTDFAEYSNMTAQCNAGVTVCTMSESYPLMNGSPGYLQLQSGMVPWTASINGLWTQPSGGTLAFDWFGY